MEAELPEGKVMPNIEVDGALAYDFNGSIDITFAEDTAHQQKKLPPPRNNLRRKSEDVAT